MCVVSSSLRCTLRRSKTKAPDKGSSKRGGEDVSALQTEKRPHKSNVSPRVSVESDRPGLIVANDCATPEVDVRRLTRVVVIGASRDLKVLKRYVFFDRRRADCDSERHCLVEE